MEIERPAKTKTVNGTILGIIKFTLDRYPLAVKIKIIIIRSTVNSLGNKYSIVTIVGGINGFLDRTKFCARTPDLGDLSRRYAAYSLFLAE